MKVIKSKLKGRGRQVSQRDRRFVCFVHFFTSFRFVAFLNTEIIDKHWLSSGFAQFRFENIGFPKDFQYFGAPFRSRKPDPTLSVGGWEPTTHYHICIYARAWPLGVSRKPPLLWVVQGSGLPLGCPKTIIRWPESGQESFSGHQEALGHPSSAQEGPKSTKNEASKPRPGVPVLVCDFIF